MREVEKRSLVQKQIADISIEVIRLVEEKLEKARTEYKSTEQVRQKYDYEAKEYLFNENGEPILETFPPYTGYLLTDDELANDPEKEATVKACETILEILDENL